MWRWHLVAPVRPSRSWRCCCHCIRVRKGVRCARRQMRPICLVNLHVPHFVCARPARVELMVVSLSSGALRRVDAVPWRPGGFQPRAE
mgnify:CR=1 FL=1